MNVRVTLSDSGKKNEFRVDWNKNWFISPVVDTEGDWQEVGKHLFQFLDGDQRYLERALEKASKQGEALDLELDICESAADWPFEMIAPGRRLGRNRIPGPKPPAETVVFVRVPYRRARRR